MPTSNWIGGTPGAWSTNADWSPSGAPGPGSDVVIDEAANAPYTVNEDFTGTISSLTVSDPNASFDPTLNFVGTSALAVTSAIDNEGTIVVSTGQSLSGGLILNDGYINLNGGLLAGPIDNEGLILGSGTIAGPLTGSGVIEANGGVLDLSGAGSATGIVFQIDNGATLRIDSSASRAGVQFAGSAGELDVTGSFSGIISGMRFDAGPHQPSTVLNIGEAVTSGKLSGTSLNLYDGTTLVATEHLAHSYIKGTHVLVSGNSDISLSATAPCYAAGTMILTDNGEKPVEDLREGDMAVVVTAAGRELRPIKWIGNRKIDLAGHPRIELAAPVRISRDAMGDGLPHRDLLVSPDHCLFVDGGLIPAVMLVNDMTIVQDRKRAGVHYFHVELDRHGILLAEGLPAESYLDTGNRSYFANAGLAMLLHPDFGINTSMRSWIDHACAPLSVSAVLLEPVWRRYAERAEQMGFVSPRITTGGDPDLRVMTAGKSIRPLLKADGRYTFILPAGTQRITLVSRATRPADLHRYLDDRRSLGIAVKDATLKIGPDDMVFQADHLPAGNGWHAAETDGENRWRWTNGAGELVFDPLAETGLLEIRLGGAATYITEEQPARFAA